MLSLSVPIPPKSVRVRVQVLCSNTFMFEDVTFELAEDATVLDLKQSIHKHELDRLNQSKRSNVWQGASNKKMKRDTGDTHYKNKHEDVNTQDEDLAGELKEDLQDEEYFGYSEEEQCEQISPDRGSDILPCITVPTLDNVLGYKPASITDWLAERDPNNGNRNVLVKENLTTFSTTLFSFSKMNHVVVPSYDQPRMEHSPMGNISVFIHHHNLARNEPMGTAIYAMFDSATTVHDFHNYLIEKISPLIKKATPTPQDVAVPSSHSSSKGSPVFSPTAGHNNEDGGTLLPGKHSFVLEYRDKDGQGQPVYVPFSSHTDVRMQLHDLKVHQWDDIGNAAVVVRVVWTNQPKMVLKSDDIVSLIQPERNADSPVTLAKCIQTFCSHEQLLDSERWKCSNCHQRVRANKKLSLSKTPDVLVVHLKRFRVESSGFNVKMVKDHQLVSFPCGGMELLDLKPYLSSSSEPSTTTTPPVEQSTKYKLYAVAQHHGATMRFGHYTAVAQNSMTKDWHKFNDSYTSILVDKTTLHRTLVNSSAYVLFYQRENTGSSINRSTVSDSSGDQKRGEKRTQHVSV